RIVTGAIEKHYEGLLGEAGASGYEYLDKIVQIPFLIPEPGRDEIMTFVAGQLDNPEPPPPQPHGHGHEPVRPASPNPVTSPDEPARPVADAGARPRPRGSGDAAGDGESPAVVPPVVPAPHAKIPFTYVEQQAFEQLADHLRPNPRHLKRLVNVYRLVRALAIAQDERLILDRPAATIRWLVMWSQWPYASLAMMRRLDAQLEAWNGKVPDGEQDADALPRLLEHVAPTLDRAARDRLDDDADGLRTLLAIGGCALSWEEIRRIRRYTVNFNPAVEEQARMAPRDTPARQPTADAQ
ncbi:MAG TPA: P-loop NTPase fold protein, partial [Solirubrobacteraceae bacterium]|nr:P-loop NTPase fold protein [Solirubrobacteraceae bacterium]